MPELEPITCRHKIGDHVLVVELNTPHDNPIIAAGILGKRYDDYYQYVGKEAYMGAMIVLDTPENRTTIAALFKQIKALKSQLLELTLNGLDAMRYEDRQ